MEEPSPFRKRYFSTIVLGLLILSNLFGESGANCGGAGGSYGMPTRFRACPYDPPGLEVSRGVQGSCSVGEGVVGDCVTDEDCFLKRKGNVCCYNRCRGITECHRFP